jgi:predicted DNA-binding protein YlxM (UPF0122 family)
MLLLELLPWADLFNFLNRPIAKSEDWSKMGNIVNQCKKKRQSLWNTSKNTKQLLNVGQISICLLNRESTNAMAKSEDWSKMGNIANQCKKKRQSLWNTSKNTKQMLNVGQISICLLNRESTNAMAQSEDWNKMGNKANQRKKKRQSLWNICGVRMRPLPGVKNLTCQPID